MPQPMTSGERTQILRAKTLYVNSLIRQNAIDNGIIGQINFNGASSSDLDCLDVAPLYFSPTQLNNDLLTNGLTLPQLAAYTDSIVVISPSGPVVPVVPVVPDPTVIAVNWTLTYTEFKRWIQVVCSADGSKLIAITEQAIHTSTDSGVTWPVLPSTNITNYRESIAISADGTKIIITTSSMSPTNLNIYISVNSGGSFTQAFSIPNSNRSYVSSSADFTKLVAYSANSLYVSVDSGNNWTQRVSGIVGYEIFRGAISLDGSKIMYTTNTGYIYISSDNGQNWMNYRVDSALNYTEFLIASSSNGSKIVVASKYGYIYTSTDSGVTWTKQVSSDSRAWSSIVSSSSGNNLVATVQGGSIYKSTDSGVTWVEAAGWPTGSDGIENWVSVSASSNCSKIVALAQLGKTFTSP